MQPESRGVSSQNGQQSCSHNNFYAARCRLAAGPASDRRPEYEVQDRACAAHFMGNSNAVPSILSVFLRPCSCAEAISTSSHCKAPAVVCQHCKPSLSLVRTLQSFCSPNRRSLNYNFHRLSRQETIAIRQNVIGSSCMAGMYSMARSLSRIHRRTLGRRPGPIRVST